jgi:hypothetical protein
MEVDTGSGVDHRMAMQVLASHITMPIFITTFVRLPGNALAAP